ncbi:MAG: hypothetical protein GX568_03220 [Candidatus Gastranaerophilales bacterium]|nr:hypothetical protein [Candidatus Gastranaerophilales bacterium]
MDINLNQVIIILAVIILLRDWVTELLNTDWKKRNEENSYTRDIFN